jgi:hypothetical protein
VLFLISKLIFTFKLVLKISQIKSCASTNGT